MLRYLESLNHPVRDLIANVVDSPTARACLASSSAVLLNALHVAIEDLERPDGVRIDRRRGRDRRIQPPLHRVRQSLPCESQHGEQGGDEERRPSPTPRPRR